jgi:hypothetical protein
MKQAYGNLGQLSVVEGRKGCFAGCVGKTSLLRQMIKNIRCFKLGMSGLGNSSMCMSFALKSPLWIIVHTK